MSDPTPLLVLGATGTVGQALLDEIEIQPEWSAIGIARRDSRATPGRTPLLPFDLVDPQPNFKIAEQLAKVEYAVYCAYGTAEEEDAEFRRNVSIFEGARRLLEQRCPKLKRVILIQGMRAYGAHIGPFKTPADERDARHLGPNFYYEQEDLLCEAVERTGWEITVLRPDVVCSATPGKSMNLSLLIAVYATICRELGIPMRFPGVAWDYLAQVTSAPLLARAILWAARAPNANGEIFNLTNGDCFRWKHLWPRLATYFNLECEEPQPLSLTRHMAAQADVWEEVQRRHDLRDIPYRTLVRWQFGDYIFSRQCDILSNTSKIRRFGFTETDISEDLFFRLFRRYQKDRLIPRW